MQGKFDSGFEGLRWAEAGKTTELAELGTKFTKEQTELAFIVAKFVVTLRLGSVFRE